MRTIDGNGARPARRRAVLPVAAAMVVLSAAVLVPTVHQHDAGAAPFDRCDQTVFSGADGHYIGHPETVIQTAGGQDPADLCHFEDDSFAAFDAHRGVAWTDDERDRLLSWGRNDARGVLFANLLRVVATPAGERTGTENAAYGWLRNRVQALRIAQAQASVAEYDTWKQDPCHYTPPAPYTYSPTGCDDQSMTVLFSGPPRPPAYEDFVRYGAVKVLGSIYNEDGALAAAQASRAMTAALAVGAVTIGIAGVATAAVQTGVSLAAIIPYAGYYGAAALAAGSAAAIVGIALGVILCVVVAVVRGIQVGEDAAIPGQLAADVTRAQDTPPDIDAMAQNTNDAEVLFAAFLDGTMPAYTDPSFEPAAPSAPAADAPGFVLTGGGHDAPTYSKTIDFIDLAGRQDTAWLDHGWWVVDPEGDDPPVLTMNLAYFSSDNRMLTARNLGDRFVVSDPAQLATDSGCVQGGCAPQTDLDYYTAPDGQLPIVAAHAVLVGDPLHFTTSPTLAPTFAQGDAVDLSATATGGLAGGNVAYRWTISRVDANDPTSTIDTVGYGSTYHYTFEHGGTYLVALSVADDLGQTITWQGSTFVTPVPKPVEVTQMVVRPPGGPVVGNWYEGGSPGLLRLTVPGSDDTHFWIDWNNDASWDEEAQGATVLLNQPDWMDQEGSYLVHIASQTDAGATSIDNYEVVVQNVRPDVPTVQVLDDGTWVSPSEDAASTPLFHEGDTVRARFQVTDPGPEDELTATLHWSDGTTQTLTGLSGGTSVGVTHTYDDHADDPRGLRVDVSDDDGAHAAKDGVVYYRVGEVAPTLTDVSAPVDADGHVTLTAAYHDLPLDVKHFTVDWGDGSATTTGDLPMTLPSDDPSGLGVFSFDHLAARHWYTSNGSFTITLSVTDGVETTTVHQVVIVTDHRPTITRLVDFGTNPGGEGRISVTAWDLDPADYAAALDVEVDWGDGTGEHPAPYDPATQTFDGTHLYAAQGDYQVTVRAYDTQRVASEPLRGTLHVTDGSPGHLAASSSTLVMGPVVPGQRATRAVTVANDGGNIATVADVTLTGPDAASFEVVDDTCTGTSLVPRATCTVDVAFAPTVEGAASVTLNVTDAADASTASVTVKGTGVAAVLRNGGSTTLDFGDVDERSTFGHLIAVTNSTTAAVGLSGIGLSGFVTGVLSAQRTAAATPLLVDPTPVDGFAVSSTTCETILEAGASCVIDVAFSPEDAGAHSAMLTVTGALEASVRLTGNGVGDDEPSSSTTSTSTTIPGGSSTTSTSTTVPPVTNPPPSTPTTTSTTSTMPSTTDPTTTSTSTTISTTSTSTTTSTTSTSTTTSTTSTVPPVTNPPPSPSTTTPSSDPTPPTSTLFTSSTTTSLAGGATSTTASEVVVGSTSTSVGSESLPSGQPAGAVVTSTDPDHGGGGTSGSPTAGPGGATALPSTGAPLAPMTVVALGLLAVGSGLEILRRRTRRPL